VQKDKLIKLAALNIGIALVNIIVFSDGLLHIALAGAGAFQTALAVTVIFMSIFVFTAGNYRLLFTKDRIISTKEIRNNEDCIAALEQNSGIKTFTNDIQVILEQIRRFDKKRTTINDILLQRFDSTEMSYQKFIGTIHEVENVFFINIKSILNKINAFDEDDYNSIRKNAAKMNFSSDFIQTKMSIYNEYITFVKDAAEDNEQILLKLDKVLLEISKLGSLEDGEIENMSAMKEIDELINNTKWYRQ
jgi:hypothetical protein